MELSLSSVPLERIDYYPLNDGTALVILRENIEEDYRDNADGTSDAFWRADEVKVVTTLPEDEIEANFDSLWVEGETASKTLEQRLAEIEALLGATIDTILEGGE